MMTALARLLITTILVGLVSCGLGRGPGITPVRTSFNRGVYHYSRGDLDAAQSEFRAALDEDASDHRARFNLALVYDEKARHAHDAQLNEDGSTWTKRAREQYLQLLDGRPQHLRAQVNLAAIEYENGDKGAARERLRQALGSHDDSALARVALASLLFRDSRTSGTADLGESLLLLDAALSLDTAHTEANWLLGECHRYLAEHERREGQAAAVEKHITAARQAYVRLLDGSPDDLAGLMAIATLELEAKRYVDSIVWLERVVHIDPDHRQAHVLLANALEHTGDLEGATSHLWAARRLTREPDRAGAFRDRLISLYQRLQKIEAPGSSQ